MKSVASILVGLVAGWLITELNDLMPDMFVDWIGSSVAGSQLVGAVLGFLPLSSETTYSVHAWVITASVVAIPILCISLMAAAVYMWTQRSRPIIYSSLAAPLFMAIMAIYYKYQLAKTDPLLAQSFWNNAEANVQAYLLGVSIFILFFALIKRLCKSQALENSHNH